MIKEHLNIDGSLDMRHTDNQHYVARKFKLGILGAIVLAFLIGCIGMTFLMRPKTFDENIFENVAIPTVTPTPAMPLVERSCYQNIDKIRCIGEDLGYDNDVIKVMIRIAKSESGFRSDAKNPVSTASGIFQIIYGTWNSNKCTGSAFNAEDNINCAYKLYARRGFQPWYASSKVWLANK